MWNSLFPAVCCCSYPAFPNTRPPPQAPHIQLVVNNCVWLLMYLLTRFGWNSFRVSGPTIWNDLPVDFRSTDITHEQFKPSLKSWLFECAYGKRRVWETVQSEGAPKKWTYLLTWLNLTLPSLWSISVIGKKHPQESTKQRTRLTILDGKLCIQLFNYD